jgi:type IV secretion system protein VirB10
MSATDPSGYAGLQDKIDFHTWQLLKGVAISTLLGIGSDLQFSGNGGLIEAIRQSGQQNVSRAGDDLTAKALDVQPTLTIRPGAPIRLIVDRDVILSPTGER